jgi:aubergine-like protein
MPIYNCKPMLERQIILIYEQYCEREAQNLHKDLMGCQSMLKVKTGEIETLALRRENGDKYRGFKAQIQMFLQDLARNGEDASQFFAVYVLDRKDEYDRVKRMLTDLNLLSQVVTKFTCKKINKSVSSNVVKQINNKVGGESIRIKMPKVIDESLVMAIGIDVCHSGPNSIVGFAASLDKYFSNYYNDFIVQPKFQELVKKDLDRALKNAIYAFKRANNNQAPTRIFIFRDGVGEQMRDQIIAKEIKQFKSAITDIYNSASIPPITLVVVNKRINQRLFVEQAKGSGFFNPPPGSIIDHDLVENEQSNRNFDFFLVPQMTTQGCVTPTHFYVCLNESTDMLKADIETFTYNLCYMYSNWSGSIKVPAPCQHSHKIAEYHNLFDTKGLIKRTCKVDQK